MSERTAQGDLPDEVVRWQQGLPWWRRLSVRLGLGGKLTLAFAVMLVAALASTCAVFITRSKETLSNVLGEHAAQLSLSLAEASKAPLAAGDAAALSHFGRDLLKSRNIVFIGFFDATGKPLAIASRDLDSEQALATMVRHGRETSQRLLQVQRCTSKSLGDYLQVLSPVLGSPGSTDGQTVGARLLGYVAVGVSQTREAAQIRSISFLGLALGSVVFLLSLPLVGGLVKRILLPIRQLAAAAYRIAAGDYGARVATYRPDEIGMLARSFDDMAQRVKQQQEALRLANQDLEQKVRQRTGELEASNRRLSVEIAEKEDFLRAVSHDLNAPLRNIGGMASMLLLKCRQKFDDDVIHRLERIQKNVEVESGLISELLELSRIKTRRQKFENVDTEAMLRDMGELFENDLRSRGIALEVRGVLPRLHCEKARLRQVFQNLIDNAIKYMGDGPERRIEVSCRLRQNEAEFAVRDTGLGIDAEDLPKVFHVFRRGRNSAAANVPGKGVGLSSVKSIIENYGGRIWVESQLGQGSVFRFTIDRNHVPQLGGGQATEPEPKPLAA